MADPVGFQGANFIYRGDGKEIRDLECFNQGGQVISCWRLSKEELEQINETGVVWLSIHSQPIPPVYVSGEALVTVHGKPSKAEPILPKAERK